MGSTRAPAHSFQIGTDQHAHLAHALIALRIGLGRLPELFAQMRLHHFGHQPVDGTTDRGDLLQYRPALGPGFQRAVECIALAADPTDPGENALFSCGEWGMGQKAG